jgi:hypothetical protein
MTTFFRITAYTGMKKSFLLGLALMILIGLVDIAQASDIFGRVRYKGRLVPDVNIEIISNGKTIAKSKTNSVGYYSIRNIDPGEYILKIQLQDGDHEMKVYVFPQNTEQNITIK